MFDKNEYMRKWKKNNSEKVNKYNRRYCKNNLEKVKEYKRKWYKTNREKIKYETKEYYKNNLEKIRKYRKEYYQENKEEINKYRRNRRKMNLKCNLNHKIRNEIRRSLKGNKEGRKWEILVGYNLIDLMRHLKKTMPKDYTWQDYLQGKLHIDHKTPISAFHFSKPEHPDFQRCWALKNLQLLPAKENFKKGNKLAKPFQPALKINLLL